jgi:hypothetical protein
VHRILRAFADHPLVAIIVSAAAVVGAIFAVLAVTESEPASVADEPAIGVDPVAGLMPRCLTLRGTAPDLPDQELWVAFRGSGASDYYYLRPTRDADKTRWQARDTVGDGTGVSVQKPQLTLVSADDPAECT